MTIPITVDIPEQLKSRFSFGTRISFEDFTQKIFGDDFVSPDVTFTPLSELSQKDKEALAIAKNYDPTRLINL